MPVLLPAPIPRFACSITLTPGNRRRTSAAVPSVEPLSTTTVAYPSTDARQRSMCSAPFQVTTTTATSSRIGDRDRRPPEALPEDHHEAGEREQQRHQEEEEPGRERRVGADAEVAEEADEERLPHPEAADRERHQHHEEEQRAEDDVRSDREVDANGAARRPDREDPGELREGRDRRDREQRPRMVAVPVDSLVGGPDRPLDPRLLQERHG